MAYEKQNFLDGQIVTADHLNHIENGIVAAQNPRNLLDNSNFRHPVNQRGASKYTGSVYTIDRWRSWNNEFSMTINNGNLSWSGGSIVQYFDTILTGVHTLAVMGSNGTLYLYSADMSQSFSYSTVLGMGTDSAGKSAVSIGDGTYIWAALYEGSYTADTLPPYVPKGYGAELTECQRYYFVTPPGGAFIFRIRNQSTSAYGAYEICPSIVFPVPMRVVPTVTLYYDLTDGSYEAKSPLSCTVRCCSMPNVVVPVNGWFDLNKVEASADL